MRLRRRSAKARPDPASKTPVGPTNRGWRGHGGGRATYVQTPVEWRATSVQACGMWPFSVGAGAPLVGAPLGRHLVTGTTVCADPISWFQQAHLLSAPTAAVLGLQGKGKSSLIRRMLLALSGFGVVPIVAGDLKPDYVDLVRALDGDVISLGRGRGYLNVLDRTLAIDAAKRLDASAHPDREQLKSELLSDSIGRRHTMVSSLMVIQRSSPLSDREDPMLTAALSTLDERFRGTPMLADLLQVFNDMPEAVRAAAIDRGSTARYEELIEPILVTLQALLGAGRVGDVFSRPSTTQVRADRPTVFDISSIPEDQSELVGATLSTCWGTAFGAINVMHALADAGLVPRVHQAVTLDEMWRCLLAGHGMTDRVNSLTRLNRQWGVGTIMITHTLKDLLSLPDEHERVKARGLFERAGMLFLGGLPDEEMSRLDEITDLAQAEKDTLRSWQTPPSWSTASSNQAPPGLGNFLLKLSGRPGIPFHVDLTHEELAINDTNKRWHEPSRLMAA
jgi:hypothetical protein